MFLLSNPLKRVSATCQLVVFLYVLLGQCFCAAAAPAPAALPGCPGHAAAKPGKAGPAPAASEKPTHGCCRDKSAAVLKVLPPPPAKLRVEAPLLLASWPAPAFLVAAFTVRAAAAPSAGPLPRRHLPPKIPDIRIFVGSLTI